MDCNYNRTSLTLQSFWILAFMLHRQFFTAKVFAKLLHNDPYGRISIMQFFNYVMRKGGLFVFSKMKSVITY